MRTARTLEAEWSQVLRGRVSMGQKKMKIDYASSSGLVYSLENGMLILDLKQII
jgi:hypothetical protein